MLKERETCLTAKSIVVVEDDINNAEMFKMVIASETPFKSFWMQSDSETLQRIDEIKAIKPALFLLDYNLPSMTAFKLYDQLHEIEEFKNVPAIILTAEPPDTFEIELQRRNLILLEKPFELDTFLDKITRAINEPCS